MPHRAGQLVGFDNGNLIMAKAVLMGLSIPVAVTDISGRIFMQNEMWQEMIPGALLDFFYQQGLDAALWDEVMRDALKQALDSLVQGKIDRFLGEISILLAGEVHWYQITLEPLDPTVFDGVVVTLFDITEQKNLLNQVSKLFSVSTQQNQALRENKVSLLAYQRELQEAKEKSDALAESKASFLATMSHEIRTPMNAIIGMAYLALKTTLTPKQHDYVDKIYQAGKGLLIILNDILDFSKLESGKMQLDPHPVNIRKFVQNMMDVYDVLARHKGLTLALVSPPTETRQSMPEVMIDEARLRQVLSNLLSNALKFTQHGGITIEVSQRYDVDQDNGEQVLVIISVHDTGIGITPEQQQHLFKDFAQADQTISRKFGGSGLGLAISAKIVALMGGEIQLTSTPNLGSTFTLVIPCDLASEPVSSSRVPSDEDNALPSALPTFEMQGSDIQSQDVVASDMTVDEIFDKIKQALLQNNGAVIDMWYDHQTLLESTLGAECAKLVFQAIDSFDFDGAISQLNQCIENKK